MSTTNGSVVDAPRFAGTGQLTAQASPSPGCSREQSREVRDNPGQGTFL